MPDVADTIQAARIRGELIAGRLANLESTMRSARIRLEQAMAELHSAEAAAASKILATSAMLSSEGERTRETVSGLEERVNEATSHVLRTSAALAHSREAGPAAELIADVQGRLTSLRGAVGAASSAIEGVRASLQESTGRGDEAVEQLQASVAEAAGSASEAKDALVLTVTRASTGLSEAVSDAAEAFGIEGTDLAGFVNQLVSASVKSPSDTLAAFTRAHVESEIQAKARDAARAVVDALTRAVDSIRSHGSSVRLHTFDLKSTFQRLDEGRSRVSASAEHVIAEEARVRRERDEGGGDGGDV